MARLAGRGLDLRLGGGVRWLKDESYLLPVTCPSMLDGTATANLAEMDGLLQDAWRPINRK